MIAVLQQDLGLFITVAAFVGLMVGSFLNVVAYRLPIMLDRQWRSDALDCLGMPPPPQDEPFTLSVPSSACPCCGHKIRPWENLPVISYVALGGKCSACRSKISLTYPAVELVTAVLSSMFAWRFGATPAGCASLVLLWALVALFLIDLNTMLLPDSITLPVLWLGLVVNAFAVFTPLQDAVLGAAAGYMSFWVVAKLFLMLRGVEGVGQGDYKLFALIGAWGGWQILPATLLVASLSTAAVGISIRLRGSDRPLPFGPGLVIGGLLCLMFGSEINHWLLYRQ